MAPDSESPKTADPSRLTVVGIGASAGGIEALRDFFGALPGGDHVYVLAQRPAAQRQPA